jgi:integrase
MIRKKLFDRIKRKKPKTIDRERNVRLGGIIRVLKPSEFEAIKQQSTNLDSEFLLDLLLNTGMRYTEIERLIKNTNENIDKNHKINNDKLWFRKEDKKIDLPNIATKTGRARSVSLTPAFTNIMDYHIRRGGKIEIPTFQGMNQNLKRWSKKAAIDRPQIIGIRTFRKTWESWLVLSDKNWGRILNSQGHKDTIALQHYIDLKEFKEEDKKKIKEYVTGW